MKGSFRSAIVILMASSLLLGMVPAAAFGAVTMTWERNFGTYKATPPYANGEMNGPGDVAADKWGNVYVTGGWSGNPADSDHRVQMFDANGTFIKKYDNPGTGVTQLREPRSITTDRWGAIYVSQSGNGRIEVFNPLLYNHSRTIDTPSTGDSTGIAVTLDGTIYNARQWEDVQRRTRLGALLGTALTPPHPLGVAVSQDGEVYVSCDYLDSPTDPADPGQKIGVYKPNGVLKWAWGGLGTAPGYFNRPFDVGVDAQTNVFVAEWDNNRAQVLSQNSDPLAVFGASGLSDQQFVRPSGIGVGFDRTVYVADHAHSRISKWKVATPTIYAPVQGADRYATAIAAAEKAYPDGADYVVLATGTDWPDALGGAALAGAVDGPLLLTRKDVLPVDVAAEIVHLKAKVIYVLGGTGAISDGVLNAAKALTPLGAAERFGGATRYETANKIAERVVALKDVDGGYDGTAFVCTGAAFPDALAAASMAAANGWPIYLTQTTALTPSTRVAMLANGSNHGYIIGGTGAVSATTAADLEAMSPMPPGAFTRHGGLNRYDTAAKVAEAGFNGMGMLYSRPAIATGENFPDALAGGVLQGSDCSVLLLTQPGVLRAETAALLAAHKDSIYEIRYLGGPGVLTPAVRTSVQSKLW